MFIVVKMAMAQRNKIYKAFTGYSLDRYSLFHI